MHACLQYKQDLERLDFGTSVSDLVTKYLPTMILFSQFMCLPPQYYVNVVRKLWFIVVILIAGSPVAAALTLSKYDDQQIFSAI